MTNHHVVEDLLAGTKDPKEVVLRFDYEVGTDGGGIPLVVDGDLDDPRL